VYGQTIQIIHTITGEKYLYMDKEEYHFNKLDKEHLPIILDMAREIIAHNYVSFLDKDLIDNFINSKQCDNEIIKNAEYCITMQLKNICIGFSIILENKIHLIMIDRKYQHKGHGTSLLNYMENKLFEKYNEIELQTFENNSIANNFYRKNGWKKGETINIDGMLLYKYKKWNSFGDYTKEKYQQPDLTVEAIDALLRDI
jgi:GNAT superfamily N-acetyltransferase